MSAPLQLNGGDVLYFEALVVDPSGSDNLGVAWETPWSPRRASGAAPIPGEFLSLEP
jgi:hypothetical protein